MGRRKSSRRPDPLLPSGGSGARRDLDDLAAARERTNTSGRKRDGHDGGCRCSPRAIASLALGGAGVVDAVGLPLVWLGLHDQLRAAGGSHALLHWLAQQLCQLPRHSLTSNDAGDRSLASQLAPVRSRTSSVRERMACPLELKPRCWLGAQWLP